MSGYNKRYTPVHLGVSITDKEAYYDYKNTSTVRDPKKIRYYKDYRRIVRKIWKKVAENSIEYESGVYAKDFFYLVPQVISNQPYVELLNGKITTNSHTDGDIYAPIFCNLFKRFNHFCWSLDGCFVGSYKSKLSETINKFAPKYYFILPTILKNNL